MRFTSRRLDRGKRPAFAIALGATMAAAVTSCGSANEAPSSPEPDAAVPASPSVSAEAAAPVDAEADAPDAGWDFDAAPRTVVCSSEPCATSLTTTLTEGYCALLHDGTVACWGLNPGGQLGRGFDASPWVGKPTPERVVGLSNVAALEHTCAIDRNDETWCWGRSAYVGDAGVEAKIAWEPVKLAIAPTTMIASTSYLFGFREEATTCAVTDGGLLCWGTNGHGQLEPGPEATSPWEPSLPLSPRTIELPPGAPVRTVALGRATLVLREDGTLLSWGSSPTIGRLSSLTPDPYPQVIALPDVSAIDVNDKAACAVSRGVAYCWGPPLFTEPPYDEGPLARVEPRAIATPEPLVQIATSSGESYSFPQRGCGVGVSGAVYCWGSNAFGQAGDGTVDVSRKEREAVKVVDLPAPAAHVRATSKSTCALLTTGKVHCWGDSASGQLGNGDLGGIVPTPVEAKLP